jgi:hypothetical protein
MQMVAAQLSQLQVFFKVLNRAIFLYRTQPPLSLPRDHYSTMMTATAPPTTPILIHVFALVVSPEWEWDVALRMRTSSLEFGQLAYGIQNKTIVTLN